MKLLLLAQTPPPLHGQSHMVGLLVENLPAAGIALHHVNLPLSRDATDIGRIRPGKVFTALAAVCRALAARFRHRCDTLYYVPAAAKRSALYRDWLILALCRPWFRRTVLHWHASGLGDWVSRLHPFERLLSHFVLDRADLAIVLGDSLRADAAHFRPREITVIRNGLADPCPNFTRGPRPARRPFHALFIGLCTREKGVLVAASAVLAANERPTAPDTPPVHLTVAGDFVDPSTAAEFDTLLARSRGALRRVGFVSGSAKDSLFAEADVLVFPTAYPHETQGLVIAEALAFDLPVIATRWRAVHEGLPAQHVYLVEPYRPDQVADALVAARSAPVPGGASRAHFHAELSLPRFIATFAAALRAIDRLN